MRDVPHYLAFGDVVHARMRSDRATAAEIAEDLDVSASVAAKASWLARAYSPADRQRLGPSALRELRTSHLEAVACVAEPQRSRLLQRAARDGLGVRALKQLADRTGQPRTALSTIRAPQVANAVAVYLKFDDEQLRRLLSGPNGPHVKRLASSGAALAARIAEHTG